MFCLESEAVYPPSLHHSFPVPDCKKLIEFYAHTHTHTLAFFYSVINVNECMRLSAVSGVGRRSFLLA